MKIKTKYIGAREKGSRIMAVPFGHKKGISIPYDSGLSEIQNHKNAAIVLCERMGRKGKLKYQMEVHYMVWELIEKPIVLPGTLI